MRNGVTGVMMDGSLEADAKTPASFEYNVNVTAEVVKVAHSIGASVEGELGCLGSLETMTGDKEDGHGFEGTLSKEQLLTDPDEAVQFVEATQVDALAVAIGTSHGAYKFTRKPTGEILAISRIEEIHSRLPNTHLVMHGSSSVPQEWLDMINQYGGSIPETYGVPLEEIQKGIKSGVRKVNIDTDNRLAITAAIREAAAKDPSNFDPRHFMKPAIKYMKQVCAERYEAFWTAGNASKIKQYPIDHYAAMYANGELDAKTKATAAV
jgi:fructose-bisphosphate aldolase class II